MDLERANGKVDRISMRDVLILVIYGVGGRLLEEIKAVYIWAKAGVRVEGDLSENLDISIGLRQGCVISTRLFSIYMDGCLREMKERVDSLGARLKLNVVKWSLIASLFAEDTVFLAESEKEMQKV